MLLFTDSIKVLYRYVVIALAGKLLMACSSFAPTATEPLGIGNLPAESNLRLESFSESDQLTNPTRGSSSIESGMGLMGKTLLADPVVRPFSTLKSLYGYALKSTTGFLERRFIASVRLPLLERHPVPGLAHAPNMDPVAWEHQLDELTSRKPSYGRIRFLVDGEEYFSRLSTSINAAEQSIDIRTYIFDNDDVALRVANLLRARSGEVEVRILVDGLADLFATRLDSASMPKDTDLPPSISRYLAYGSNVKFRKQSNPWFTGDHAKITVIDQHLAFVGGMNIGREYRYDWHDLMMEVEGPVVSRLQYEFNQAWAKSGWLGDLAWLSAALDDYEVDETKTGYPIRILSTTIHDSEIYRAQVAAIRNARNRIYIENTYFSDDKILFELARARRRGVDVRVILSSQGDSGMLDLSNQKASSQVLDSCYQGYGLDSFFNLEERASVQRHALIR